MKVFSFFMFASLAFNLNAFAGGDDAGNGGNNFLNKSMVNQYTCLAFGGKVSSDGSVERTNFARQYFYYLDEETPDPIFGNPMYVCHDYILYGNEDSAELPRLETIESFPMFNRFDVRMQPGSNGKYVVDVLIEEALAKDYGIAYQSNSFMSYNFSSTSWGYYLKPFTDTYNNRVYCPSSENINITPLDKVIMSFTGDTEGLYYGVKEKEIIGTGSQQQEITASLLVTETQLLKYGFYIRDNVKTPVSDKTALDLKTVFFYYPFSDTQDPLMKGNRKLVTVKFYKSSNSKKVGCIPKQ